MGLTGFLGQALTDPATGLPNIPYFNLIQDWVTRRAQRRNSEVKVLTLRLQGAADRTLAWRLCQELRTSDLIASEGRHCYRILLTSPDAENVGAIGERIEAMIGKLNEKRDSDPLALAIGIEPDAAPEEDPGPWCPGTRPVEGEADAG
ncbi:MAG: hypothetical protein ACR2L6_12560 [Gemmatimonadaceae bacterium]